MNITKKNAKAAWDAGCSDVKKVLEALFPEMVFRKPSKYNKDEQVKVTLTIDRVDEDDKDQMYLLHSDGVFDDDEDGEFRIHAWVSEEELTKMLSR